MKKIMLLLLVFVVTICSAQVKSEVNGKTFRVKQDTKWRSSDIVSEPEVKENSIVYNNSTKTLSYVESKKQKEKPSYFILIGIISLILMILSNIFYCKSNNTFVFLFVIVTFVFALVFAIIFVLATFIIFATIFVFDPFNIVVVVFAFDILIIFAFIILPFVIDDKKYKVISIMHYVIMVICFILFVCSCY